MAEAGDSPELKVRGAGVPLPSSRLDVPRFGTANVLGYRLLHIVTRLSLAPWLRLRAEGSERLPAGPCVLAPNHASYLDPVVLQAVLADRRIVFLMTRAWYERPVLRPFFRAVGAIPVDADRTNRDALERAVAALRAGHPVGIFPEGAVSGDGRLGAFHPGVAAVALRARVPVVPVGLRGTSRALPKGAWFPRPQRVTVRFGQPLGVAADAGSRREGILSLTGSLRDAVASLLRDAEP